MTDFSSRGGEMAARVAAHDWAASPLGPREGWPPHLRTVTDIVLQSPLPMALLWGDEGCLIYNDHYATIAGRYHPAILGRPVADAWPEAADFNRRVLRAGLAGEPLTFSRQRITVYRDGFPAEVFFDLTYAPVFDPAGDAGGVLAVVIEVTQAVAMEQELIAETHSLETLNRIGTALAAELDLEPLVQMVTDAGVTLTGAKFGAYFHNQMDEDGKRLNLFTLSGASRAAFEGFGKPRATAVFTPTFRNEGVLRSDDIQSDPRYGHNAPHRGLPEGHLPVRSYLAAPVASRSGEVLGGLLFGHPEPGRFHARHERLLVGIAAQAAIAIDNARLFGAVQEVNDTLERRVAERSEALTRAHEALRQAQKMETLGQLTGGIAHDFNNLLTVIRGSTELLRRPGLSEERRDRYIEAIAQTADRASTLTGQLLAFARRSSLTPQVFDVGDTIRGLTDMMEMLAGALITVDLDLPDVACFAHADVSQFETAIVNMAVNARDAMGKEGRLTIAVDICDRIPPVRGHSERSGDFLKVSITDTGTGIPPDHIDRIFEPFFTSKGVGHGTGLGLSQVFGFAKQSGGDVLATSCVGEGATFTLFLPRERAAPAVEASPASHAAATGTPLRILVVEDNPEVGTFATAALSDLGHDIVLARNAKEALGRLEGDGDGFDVVFSDVMMPGMNGIELAHVIRTRLPELPIILTSGYSEILSKQGAGEFELLHKPYSIDALSAAFQRLAPLRSD
ncbi:ATP-binding protein [Sphingomonas sp. CD22]|uniref:hybrid sensor histidine kinase/response regulator n=1 Tax=Sphingomonas sp. CD22 TaxID=3100214 RepID=UPI002ADFFCFB|nr:ATP-binding protein [Sphingomonas sp. CD22]MEA1086007.1 ATP-binding protein [Sphingomonas sp. CD22]